MRKLIIIGAGGFGAEAVWVAQEMNRAAGLNSVDRWDLAGYADEDTRKTGDVLNGLSVLGTLTEAAESLKTFEVYYFCAVGKNRTRQRLAETVSSRNWRPVTLIHPSAIIAPRVVIEEGTYIGPGTVLCPGARVGCHVIVNTHVSVGHDAQIGNFAQACPGVRISGDCVIEELAFLGSNASIAPGVRVGREATVGANSFAFRKIKPGITALGIPAQAIA